MTVPATPSSSRQQMQHSACLAVCCWTLLLGCGQNSPTKFPETAEQPAPAISKEDKPSTNKRAEKSAPHTQLYDGLSLAQWRERIKSLDPDSPVANESVPGLMAIIQDKDAPWFSRRQAALTLGRIGLPAKAAVPVLIGLLDQTNGSENSPRLWAIQGLALFGPVAQSATPALVSIVKDESRPFIERVAPLDALSRIGIAHPAAIPGLIWALNLQRSDDSKLTAAQTIEFRALAAEAMTLLGPNGKSAVPFLIRATRNESELIRRNSIATLGTIGSSAEIAIPALAEVMVLDSSPVVRDAAAAALAKIGSASVPMLESLLTDEESEVRWRAAASLGKIEPAAKKAVPSLLKVITDENPTVRINALEALWSITKNVTTVLTPLLNELFSEDRQIRIRAVRLLVTIGYREKTVRDRLEELQKDDQPHVRQAARQALQKIEANQKSSN